MPAATQQMILDALGLSSMNSQAQRAWDWSERAVCNYLRWGWICEQSVTEYLPLTQQSPLINDPYYVVDSGYQRAVPANYYDSNILQLRHVPVRSVAELIEDWTGFFGQMSGSFPSSGTLHQGPDFFLKNEEDGLCWSGQLVRRSFWFPNVPGSIKVTYTAGFTDAELQAQYLCFGEAVSIAAQYRYLRMKAVSLGQFPDVASESLGGGASASYRDAFTFGEAIPDAACALLLPYRFCGSMAL